MKERKGLSEYLEQPKGDWIPIESSSISKFKELLVKFFGIKRATHKGIDYYLYRGKLYCILHERP